jgi:integrase
MTEIRNKVDEYLEVRRSLGYELREPGQHLRSFASFMENQGASFITTDLALQWATRPSQATPATWADRLGVVRRFARWYSTFDARIEIPPEGLLPHHYQRVRPHIYSDDELQRILNASGQLASSKGLRAHTFKTIFGLIAVTGMRVNEALGLDRRDVDLQEGILTLRNTKFGKTRFVPLHSSTRDVLAAYAAHRDQLIPVSFTEGFFVAEKGTRIQDCCTHYTFALVSRRAGLRQNAGGHRHGHGPRIHDMRHRYAVTVLLNWYKAGLDVERELPRLSTYLGHRHINDTYWYIEAIPELLALATERLEGKHKGGGA